MRTIGIFFIGTGIIIGVVYMFSGLSLMSDFGIGVAVQTFAEAVFRGGVLAGIGLLLMAVDAAQSNSADTFELLQRMRKRTRDDSRQ